MELGKKHQHVKEKEEYDNKEVLRYKCIEPYNETPEGEWICENGEWNGTFVCMGKICPPPPYVENGDYTASKNYGNEITEVYYTCQPHYVLNMKQRYYKCEKGKWETPPKCLKPCEITPEIFKGHNVESIREKFYLPHATRRQTGFSRHIYVVKLSLSLRSTLSHQEPAARWGSRTRLRLLTHPLPTSSQPHPAYVCGASGPPCPVRVSLKSASQPDQLAPPHHQTRLYDSVRLASTQVQCCSLHFIHKEIAVLMAKDSIESVPPADMKTVFYSPYFIVPKKGGGLWPILDLRVLNRALYKLPFKMLTQNRIFKCIRPRDWFAAIDLKDAYFHVSILLLHRPFLHFAF
ncbi:unnamed protein product [Leuciscus chuanchicus]